LEVPEVDRCSFCEGIFFDAGEIEELYLKRDAGARQNFMRRLLRI
jgi:Zn-finger nucleic acid-binding protein